jgi:uncharacterized protein
MLMDKSSKLSRLHLFQCKNETYAFEPSTMRILALDLDEVQFINKYNQIENSQLTDSHLKWDESRISRIKNSLVQKELLTFSEKPLGEVQASDKRIEFIVNVAQDCNLACKYCFVKQGNFNYSENQVRMLAPPVVKKFIEMLPGAFPWAQEFCIHFYGGEPLLNLPAIKMAVETATAMQEARFTFTITTNGTILNEEILSTLRKGRFYIVLSIDGPEKIHDKVRYTTSGEPTHAKVLKFLYRIKEDPPLFVRGSSVVRKGWSLWDAYSYLKTLPLDAIKINAVRLSEDHPLALNKEDLQQYFNDLGKIAGEIIESLAKGKVPKSDRFNDRLLDLYYHRRRASFCGAGRKTFGLASDGTILPCALMAGKDDIALGKVEDLNKSWIDKGRKWAMDHLIRSKCESCWALPLCEGNCQALIQYNEEFECEIIRVHCELALKIYAAFQKTPEKLLILEKTTSPYQHH